MLVSTFLPVVVSAVDVAPSVWTDRPDYQSEDTVTIQGSGFSANSVVTITILKPDGNIDSVYDADGSPYVTDENGAFTAYYKLDEITGTYTVTATDESGNTTATTFTASSLVADDAARIWTDRENYAPGDTVMIYGTGFIADASVTVDVTRPDTTWSAWPVPANSSGGFTTSYLLDGIATDGNYTVTATDGTNTATTTFIDCTISGVKFNDLDGDGVKDSGEPKLSGWTIRLYRERGHPNHDWVLEQTKTTDGNGAYSFAPYYSANYRVCEVLQTGWTQTRPTSNVCSDFTGVGQKGYEFWVSGSNVPNKDFGNKQAGTTLTADKTANPHWTRTYHWTIDKSVTPATWDLFRGDSGTSQYTVSVTKDGGTEEAWIDGQICVTNGGAVATEGLQIIDKLYDGLPPPNDLIATVTVDLGTHSVLAPGESFCYLYRVDIPAGSIHGGGAYKDTAEVTITNHAGHVGVPWGPSPSATTNLPTNPTTTNDQVNVVDTYSGPWTFSASGSQTYTKTFVCDGDQGEHDNTATIQETQQSASASVTVSCYVLEVQKTAEPSFTRTYGWTIEKFADESSLTLAIGESHDVNYEVTLDLASPPYTDSDWAVIGTITVHNPAPIPATINSVSDVISPSIVAAVDCGVSFPYTLAAGGDLECSYNSELPDASSRTNTATATLQNYDYDYTGTPTAAGTTDFSGTADVNFNEATITEVDKCIDVSDTFEGDLGTVCYGVDTLPKTFSYIRTVGPYETCGDYQVENTASFEAADTSATGSDSWTLTVQVPCSTVEGDKFEDADGDGQPWETGEAKLQGWTINIYDASGGLVDTETTDENGHYEFDGLASGTYTVCEVLKPGYTQTYPTSGDGVVSCPSEGSTGYEVTVSSGEDVACIDFGNFALGEKGGMKFNDLNGDGVKDSGEPGLDGWTINLYDSSVTTLLDTKTTSGGGLYSFTGLAAGDYVVCEVLQSGWVQTLPTAGPTCPDGTDGYSFTVDSGFTETSNDFGNIVTTATSTISTTPSPSITLGQSVYDTATLDVTTDPAPVGEIIFKLFGPGPPGTCSVLVFTSTIPVSAPVSAPVNYVSDSFAPTEPGHYEWLATYHSLDPYHSDAFHACGDEPVDVEKPAALPSMMVDSGYMPARGGHDPRIPLLPVLVDGVSGTCPIPLPCTLTLQDTGGAGSMHTFTAPKVFKFGGVTFRFHHWQDENGARLSSKNSFKYPLQAGKTLTAIYTVPTITLTVYVYDAVTHKPIKGALVYDDDGRLLGATNSRGRLVVRIVPDPFRLHVLKITSTGHGDYYTLPIDLTRSRTVRAYVT